MKMVIEGVFVLIKPIWLSLYRPFAQSLYGKKKLVLVLCSHTDLDQPLGRAH